VSIVTISTVAATTGAGAAREHRAPSAEATIAATPSAIDLHFPERSDI
jgi:methionine-rich copper-binding protein CopC